MSPLPQLVELVVWFATGAGGATTTGAGTCTICGGGACTTAGTGTVSTSFELVKHPATIPLTAIDIINDE
jgi:hypothetical protein